jgi:phosphohistidine phosphatase
MALYLVQHGKALAEDVDPERGLSEEGISEVERIAGTAGGYRVRVSVIEHSGKKRARQTAEILAAALRPAKGVLARSGLNPQDEVKPVAREAVAGRDAMLVGHLPFMERLASYLVTGKADKLVFRFQNGGIVCLDQEPDARLWHIKWALMPHIG